MYIIISSASYDSYIRGSGAMSGRAALRRAALLDRARRNVTSCQVMPCRAVLCRAVPGRVASRRAAPRSVARVCVCVCVCVNKFDHEIGYRCCVMCVIRMYHVCEYM